LSRFGPGAAHLHELMRYAIERGCDAFDFTIGDEPYKRDWCDTELKLYDHIAAVTPRGWLVAAPVMLARRAKRAIKQSPLLWRLVTRLRAISGSAKASSPADSDAGSDSDRKAA
jgi:CelD/BcsL family acetyltransferase involved in cellulose biosynthesis